MKRIAAVLLASVSLSMVLAGCASSPSGSDHSSADPIIVTAPDDYSYLNQSDPWSRPHLHDYWGGQTTKTVTDIDVPILGTVVITGPGERIGAGLVHMGDGEVVPPGTGNVSLRITHEPQPGDVYTDLRVAVRTANGDEFGESLPVTDQPIRLALGPADADLPHQALSAWRFSITVASPGYGPTRISGRIHLTLVAERGLPIPLYPGHPDQWGGSSELALFHGKGLLLDSRPDLPDYGPGCISVVGACPYVQVPDAGQVVPYDAAVVQVRLWTGAAVPPGLALEAHGGDTWEFTTLQPIQVSGNLSLYEIPVQGNGDGPYTHRSSWEFRVVGRDRRVEYGTYAIEAVAMRAAPLLPADASSAGAVSDVEAAGPETQRDLIVTPGKTYPFTIVSDGKPLEVTLQSHNGIVRDGVLHGPGTCKAELFSDSIIVGLSTYGNLVVHARCGPVPAGRYGLSFDSGDSAFTASIHLTNATFV